jgi:predicted nucleic acid-binding protein
VTLVDSSVWIDYFRGTPGPQADRLDALLGVDEVLIGDLMLTEVLQGFDSDADFKLARKALSACATVTLGGPALCLRAAQNFRALRRKGTTVRKTIDTLIATYCIEHDLPLLYSDRDFDGFVRHLGLRSALGNPALG